MKEEEEERKSVNLGWKELMRMEGYGDAYDSFIDRNEEFLRQWRKEGEAEWLRWQEAGGQPVEDPIELKQKNVDELAACRYDVDFSDLPAGDITEWGGLRIERNTAAEYLVAAVVGGAVATRRQRRTQDRNK